jgi:S-formylglutathione hydrolase FrmB
VVPFYINSGDHDFAAWGGSLGDALQYLAGFVTTAR